MSHWCLCRCWRQCRCQQDPHKKQYVPLPFGGGHKKCKILFCYIEMAWIDLLRQLGNFNWGPGWCNNIVTSRGIILSRQRTTKALIRLHRCAGWSASLLFAYGRISHDMAHFLFTISVHAQYLYMHILELCSWAIMIIMFKVVRLLFMSLIVCLVVVVAWSYLPLCLFAQPIRGFTAQSTLLRWSQHY